MVLLLLSWLFNLVEHASFAVVYARRDVVVSGFLILSDGYYCEPFNLLFEVSDVVTMLGSDSHVHHFIHVGHEILFNPVDCVAMRSSYVLTTYKIPA